ncbi:MAG: IS110 family transposase, partial [Aliihoeflea sp.]|uniref:IS110 family transposase n=1 Tax=Aliihoeflea sp. TaxID=2608088 RepID=UPI00403789FE
MAEVSTIGLDIAKTVFHAHGADARGQMVFSRRLTRAKLLEFFSAQPRCVVALEACGGAHHWAREIASLGHEVKLIPPAYVKPFVKRNKNDAVDAVAICEAAQRPSMRYAAIKTEAARTMFLVMTGQLEHLNEQVALLDKEIARRAREDEAARRLMTIPGIGPITATALLALAPPVEGFARDRDFAAWLGLTPRQHSTGGKERLGAISRMGERTLRRLLIIGSSAVVLHASRRGAPRGSWLEQMLARKPRMLVTVALANKTARIVWAVLMKGE